MLTRTPVRRAKLHLSAPSNMLDSSATAITRAAERDCVGDALAEDIAALRSSARMLVDLLSE